MNKYPGHGLMGMLGVMDDDARMLCKVLDSAAAQALVLKRKIKMGRKLPSWAEYKVYKAGDALKSAMSSTHSMRDHMPRISISIKSGPSLGMPLSGNTEKHKIANPSNTDGMAWVRRNPSEAPIVSQKGERLYKDGNLNDKNYKLRTNEKMHWKPKNLLRTKRSADLYVKTSSAWAKVASPSDRKAVINEVFRDTIRAKNDSRSSKEILDSFKKNRSKMETYSKARRAAGATGTGLILGSLLARGKWSPALLAGGLSSSLAGYGFSSAARSRRRKAIHDRTTLVERLKRRSV